MNGYRPDVEHSWLAEERKRDWLMLIPATIIFALVWHFTTREKALASVMTLLILYVLVTQMWEYRRERWFRAAISAFALIHVVVICLVPFPSPLRPAIVYVFPITMADGFAMYGIVRWLASKLSRSNVSS